ncbi:hypothetical protein BGW80DRAFT_1434558 [Lactifluus volemus]|nr:hypothetical protein BGW80DRAFT_1434558 [Lactifluus volemus]
MPKASKKKKEKVVDFSKAKLKLGKGKKLPVNQVDTSFKARSIALPTQSITVEKDVNAPTTRRKLTLTDLVTHLKHHNSNVKKDALLGLRELLEAHTELIESSLAFVMGACARMIADEDASVRRALLSFFTWFLPRTSAHDLGPHSSTLLLFTTSAQTHIFPEIQIDAIQFLDLYLDTFPDVVVCGWRDGKSGHGKRILEGYLSILSAGTKLGEGDTSFVSSTSAANTPLSMLYDSKLVVFRSMSKFLTVALRSFTTNGNESRTSTSSNPTWGFSSAFLEPTAYEPFNALFRPTINLPPDSKPPIRRWKAEVDPEDDAEHFAFDCRSKKFESADAPYSLQDLHNVILSTTLSDLDSDPKLAGQRSDFEMRLARALHPVLMSNFLDSAPSVFTPSSTPLQTELGIVLALACIYRNLYGALLQGPRTNNNTGVLLDNLQVILERMAPYFPFIPSPLVRCDVKQVAPRNSKGRDSIYVARLLRGASTSSHSVGWRITAQDYMALLPTVWMLLSSDLSHSGIGEDDTLGALLDHALQVSSASAIKRSTVDFLVRLTLLETAPQYIGTFRMSNKAGSLQKLEQWIMNLPRTLWELGDTDVPCTEVVVLALDNHQILMAMSQGNSTLLLRLFQRRSPLAQTDASMAVQLCSRLVPYFTITHPERGTLPGPFTKLGDPSLQRLALDVAVTITSGIPRYGLPRQRQFAPAPYLTLRRQARTRLCRLQ